MFSLSPLSKYSYDTNRRKKNKRIEREFEKIEDFLCFLFLHFFIISCHFVFSFVSFSNSFLFRCAIFFVTILKLINKTSKNLYKHIYIIIMRIIIIIFVFVILSPLFSLLFLHNLFLLLVSLSLFSLYPLVLQLLIPLIYFFFSYFVSNISISFYIPLMFFFLALRYPFTISVLIFPINFLLITQYFLLFFLPFTALSPSFCPTK